MDVPHVVLWGCIGEKEGGG